MALAMIAGLQLLIPATPLPQEPPGLAARRPRPVVAPTVADYPAILAAPLFTPDRKSPDPDAAVAGGDASMAGYAALGAVRSGRVTTALVSAPGGKVKSLHPGDDLDGWRLVGVDRTHVIFERNGTRQSLVIGAPAGAPSQASPADRSGADTDSADQ